MPTVIPGHNLLKCVRGRLRRAKGHFCGVATRAKAAEISLIPDARNAVTSDDPTKQRCCPNNKIKTQIFVIAGLSPGRAPILALSNSGMSCLKLRQHPRRQREVFGARLRGLPVNSSYHEEVGWLDSVRGRQPRWSEHFGGARLVGMTAADDFDFLSLDAPTGTAFVDFEISIIHHEFDQSSLWWS